MRKITALIFLCLLLTGCPGGKPAPQDRATFINGDHLCFSTNKKDKLNYYTVYSSKGGDITIVTGSGRKQLSLSYPDSCIDINWKYGYNYTINYGLNGKDYVQEFFIDNDSQQANLGEL